VCPSQSSFFSVEFKNKQVLNSLFCSTRSGGHISLNETEEIIIVENKNNKKIIKHFYRNKKINKTKQKKF